MADTPRPGGGVFMLEEPGKSMKVRRLVEQPDASFQTPDLSYDARTILFAACSTDTTQKDARFYRHLLDDGGRRRATTNLRPL